MNRSTVRYNEPEDLLDTFGVLTVIGSQIGENHRSTTEVANDKSSLSQRSATPATAFTTSCPPSGTGSWRGSVILLRTLTVRSGES